MSPILKKKGEKFTVPGKYLLFVLTILCCVMLIVTFATEALNIPFNSTVSYLIVPYERGISAIGRHLSARKDELVNITELISENDKLKERIAELESENTILMQDKYELSTLRDLFKLDEAYEAYAKTGARVIYRDSSNWFSAFIIDKGSDDGLSLDMNVIAGSGLVGRITLLGKNWSKVTTIVSDGMNVSSTALSSNDNLIVSGSLELINSGVISFSQLLDKEDYVSVGDKVVTSNISDKFMPGILIGYISEIHQDSNNLTKSGFIIPVVDFEHIDEVLIILDKKQTITDEDMEEALSADKLN